MRKIYRLAQLKNHMAHLRWWAKKVSKNSVITKDNIQLGIEHWQYVMAENRAKHVNDLVLPQISDP